MPFLKHNVYMYAISYWRLANSNRGRITQATVCQIFSCLKLENRHFRPPQAYILIVDLQQRNAQQQHLYVAEKYCTLRHKSIGNSLFSPPHPCLSISIVWLTSCFPYSLNQLSNIAKITYTYCTRLSLHRPTGWAKLSDTTLHFCL